MSFDTRSLILETGLALWEKDVKMPSTLAIAREMKMHHATIVYHFKTADALKNAIAALAVERGTSKVVAHLIAMNHPAVAGKMLCIIEQDRFQ